jgi:hypothetical protein
MIVISDAPPFRYLIETDLLLLLHESKSGRARGKPLLLRLN